MTPIWNVIRELLFFKPQGTRTDIAGALRFLTKVSKRRSVVFLVSDFFSQRYERALTIAHRRHDVIAIALADQRERALLPLGFMEFEDAETGEALLLDTADAGFRRRFEQSVEKTLAQRDRFFRSMRLDCIQIQTDQPYLDPLVRFFRIREKRR